MGILLEPLIPVRCQEQEEGYGGLKVGGIWQRILNDATNQETCAGRPYLKVSYLVMVIDYLIELKDDINWLSKMSNIKDHPFTDGHGWVGGSPRKHMGSRPWAFERTAVPCGFGHCKWNDRNRKRF